MANDITLDPRIEEGLTDPRNRSQLTTFLFGESEKNRLLTRLNDIEENDPLSPRRLGINPELVHQRLISKEFIKDLAKLQNILEEPMFVSHRKYLGHFIIIYKKIMVRFFRKWLGLSLQKQFELNQRVLNLALAVHTLENRVANLEKSNQSSQ